MLKFQTTVLGNLDLTDVPGIDKNMAQDMKFHTQVQTPLQLMGMFMLFGCDKKKMKAWLFESLNMEKTDADKVTESLEAKANQILSC